uniref:FH2 domain-containing protein n=1 Tax=Macrostomum lignano TaxID=282301 RepID=A0A1I8JQ18_9PLAT
DGKPKPSEPGSANVGGNYLATADYRNASGAENFLLDDSLSALYLHRRVRRESGLSCSSRPGNSDGAVAQHRQRRLARAKRQLNDDSGGGREGSAGSLLDGPNSGGGRGGSAGSSLDGPTGGREGFQRGSSLDAQLEGTRRTVRVQRPACLTAQLEEDEEGSAGSSLDGPTGGREGSARAACLTAQLEETRRFSGQLADGPTGGGRGGSAAARLTAQLEDEEVQRAACLTAQLEEDEEVQRAARLTAQLEDEKVQRAARLTAQLEGRGGSAGSLLDGPTGEDEEVHGSSSLTAQLEGREGSAGSSLDGPTGGDVEVSAGSSLDAQLEEDEEVPAGTRLTAQLEEFAAALLDGPTGGGRGGSAGSSLDGPTGDEKVQGSSLTAQLETDEEVQRAARLTAQLEEDESGQRAVSCLTAQLEEDEEVQRAARLTAQLEEDEKVQRAARLTAQLRRTRSHAGRLDGPTEGRGGRKVQRAARLTAATGGREGSAGSSLDAQLETRFSGTRLTAQLEEDEVVAADSLIDGPPVDQPAGSPVDRPAGPPVDQPPVHLSISQPVTCRSTGRSTVDQPAVHLSINQPVHLSINQPVHLSIKPAGPPVDQASRPPVDQPAGPPVDTSRPPVDQPAGPPVDQPAGPPVDQPAGPPVDQSVHLSIQPAGPPSDPFGPPRPPEDSPVSAPDASPAGAPGIHFLAEPMGPLLSPGSPAGPDSVLPPAPDDAPVTRRSGGRPKSQLPLSDHHHAPEVHRLAEHLRLAAKSSLDGLTNEQVIDRWTKCCSAHSTPALSPSPAAYNPDVNRVLVGPNHLVIFVSLEKDQQLRPGQSSSAKFELPAGFLDLIARGVQVPVRDICDIYREIITCPYVQENKERIKLQMTVELSPFFSRELLTNSARLNNSVEVLKNGDHYYTMHHKNNAFELEVLGQKVMLDLWITARNERHPNSTDLAAQFLHNLEHYMETHSSGDVFFLRLSNVRIS